MKTKLIVLGACVLAAGLAGCMSSKAVPTDKLARAQETVRIAESQPPTSIDPKSAQHLQLARAELTRGKRLMLAGKNDQAKWALMRAQADGEVAVYQAQAQAAKTDAQATLDAINQAMSQMQMQGGH